MPELKVGSLAIGAVFGLGGQDISQKEIRFQLWKESECLTFGITAEQHDKLLEVAGNIAAAGLGWHYEFLVNMIERPRVSSSAFADFATVFAQQPVVSTQKQKVMLPRKYKSKKLRRG